MITLTQLFKRSFGPLASRKVRVALATVVAAFGANWGFDVDEELVLTILGVGASLILGIAHEDAGRSVRSTLKEQSTASNEQL